MHVLNSALHIAGFCSGQAAGCRGLPGVLSLHLREEHPQRVPHRSDGLHQQAAGPPQEQPHPPPLQKTSPPPQQVGFALVHIQEGEDEELLGHVSGDLMGYSHHATPSPCLFGLGEGGVGTVLSGLPAESFPHPPGNQTLLRRGGHLAVHLLLNLLAHICLFPLPFIPLLSKWNWSKFDYQSNYLIWFDYHFCDFTLSGHMLILFKLETWRLFLMMPIQYSMKLSGIIKILYIRLSKV